jgi:PleD family two-component response regulator
VLQGRADQRTIMTVPKTPHENRQTGASMSIEAMATRMSVLTRALPMRILLVDDDDLELALMADRIGSAGFEVARAMNGEEALDLLARQWFPLVITDWQMPVMDGIAFTEALRLRGVDDTYVIMLTMRESSMDYERGYLAGVDDYLTKRLPDSELFARIHAAFNTLALRRSLKEAQAALATASPVDADTGAFTRTELLGKLRSELRRAQRYGRMLSVLTIGVRVAHSEAAATAEALQAVVQALQKTVRTHVDWVARLDEASKAPVFAIVLPEAAPGEGPKIKERLRAALAAIDTGAVLEFEYGLVSLDRTGGEGRTVEAEDLLAVAELCRACSGHTGAAQLSAVQRSVAAGVTIACRHGYAVDSHCTLKAELAPQVARPEPSASANRVDPTA